MFYKNMFKSLLRWCFGYRLIEVVEDFDVPLNATHILVIKGKKLRGRLYNNMFVYDELIPDNNTFLLSYNKKENLVYDKICSKFHQLSLAEFINLAFPNQELYIEYIKVEHFLDRTFNVHYTQRVSRDDGYFCACTGNAENCIYHKFLIENLYKKYIQNDGVTKNSNSRRNFNDYRSLV